MPQAPDLSEPASASETGRAAFAARLRALRKARRMTLQDVADRSGLAVSTVSKIERNLMAPTYDRFTRLANALSVDVSELFADRSNAFQDGAFAVARHGDFGFLETDNYTYEMLFPDVAGKSMVPMLGTLKPLEQMRFDAMVEHEGEEFLMVLDGRVLVQVEGRPNVILNAGDSIYFDSRRGHLYASAQDTDARILCVCTQMVRASPPDQG